MPWPRPIMSVFRWAMILSSAMAWTMRAGIEACPISGKCRASCLFWSRREALRFAPGSRSLLERLEQPVQIIAFLLRPVHLSGATAQLFQNLAGPGQIAGAGNLHAGIAQLR